MLRHSTGYALAPRGMDTRRLQHPRARQYHQYGALYGHEPGAVQRYLEMSTRLEEAETELEAAQNRARVTQSLLGQSESTGLY